MSSGSLRIAHARSPRNNNVNEHAADIGKGSRVEGEHPALSDLKVCRLVSVFRQFIRTILMHPP